MSWTEKVHCAPCRGTTDWIVQNGVWTCFHCGAPMTTAEIAKFHARGKL
jgi:hypothetical protein